jgi:hypothetical protein
LTFGKELKRYEAYESSDSVCSLVHPVGVVLAAGIAGFDFISNHLAAVAAFPSARHHCARRVRSGADNPVSAGSDPGMAKSLLKGFDLSN